MVARTSIKPEKKPAKPGGAAAPCAPAKRRQTSIAARALAAVRANAKHLRAPLQHILITGPAGAGKTATLRRIGAEAARLTAGKSASPPLVVAFSQSDCAIIAPEALLQRPTDALLTTTSNEPRYPWRGGDEAAWQAAEERLAAAISQHQQDQGGPRLILLLVDGLDRLLARGAGDDDAQSRIRDMLQNNAHVMMIATARSSETQNDPDRRIFQAFQPLEMPVVDAADLLVGTTDETGGPNPQDSAAGAGHVTAHVKAKAAAAAVLLADAPRHVRSFMRLVEAAPMLSLRAQYNTWTGMTSDLLLETLEALAVRPRRFMDALIRGGEPARPTDIAERLGTKSSDISQTTKELLGADLIALHPLSSPRRRLYFCRDRLLADCYRRASAENGDPAAVDLGDGLAVLAAHIGARLAAPSALNPVWQTAARHIDAIRQAFDREGRAAAYMCAAAALPEAPSSPPSATAATIDALTAQLIETPLPDAPLQRDLADLADARLGRPTHGLLLRAAAGQPQIPPTGPPSAETSADPAAPQLPAPQFPAPQFPAPQFPASTYATPIDVERILKHIQGV